MARHIIHKERGVSPVIAEILMIAVTMVLVVSLYYMITSGIISTPYGTNQLNGMLRVDYSKSNNTSVYFRVVMSYPLSVEASRVGFTIIAGSHIGHLTYSGNLVWSNKSANSKWHYEAKLLDNDGDGKFSNGDSVVIYVVDDNPSDNVTPPSFKSGDKVIFSINEYNGVSTGGEIHF